MDFLDIRDLPEKEARFVAALVEFLRERRGQRSRRVAQEAVVSPPRQTFIHHLAVSGKNFDRLRQCIADHNVRHPGVIRNHAPGYLGKTYMVFATADLSELFRGAGIPCSVTRL